MPYADVNGIQMYYEVHGTGDPLVVIPGGLMTIAMMGPLVSALAPSRQVIAIEPQAHGHTADIDRPLTYEQMADDTAALTSSGFRWAGRLRCRPPSGIPRRCTRL